ncbi:extracellular solute-binding protein [Virgibacillus dakarensis]|uniref:Maltodextrin-binding protein n=1 Tax=Lentibacillus populi TaxID=1827502 RepID=A0A9W5TUU4_9BACI|nr:MULTISPECIES: extracellular solute-binding protein [Bacillaceae]MBT2216776.1 extracellular solute-binding protein [Virgibacillus dakarensis]MTW84330.1 extracellular solute-binding protein [Virgibacillus dakarensis]GGB32531.1 maltose ABC transporter substrate-binding protein [Lentibacillus populi]
MKKKKGMLLLALVLLLTLLAACAPNREDRTNANTDEGKTEKTEKPEELTIWANDEEKQLEAIKKIAADYEEKEGIKVNVVAKAMLDQLQELSLAGPEGKGPDLFFQPHDQTGNIVAQGLAEPLDLSDEETNGYSKAAIEAVTYNFDGKTDIYGIPAVIETYGIFYNKDIVSKAPKTIDDLLAILEENTDASNEQYGFLMKPNDLYFAFPFFKNYGSYIFGGDTGEYNTDDIGLNNEGSVEGGKLFQSFFGGDKIPASTTVDVVDGLFTEGKVGAVINGPWSIASYKEALGDSVGFAPFPTINGEPGQTLVGVKSWFVSYYSEDKDWAKELALFMTNEENLSYYFEVAGELPPNTNALESIDDPIYSAFAEQIKHGVPMPSTPQMSQVWEPMNNALQFLAEGEEVQSVLDEAVQQMEDNIAASGSGQ